MHDFIERIGGWTPVAIFGGAVIIAGALLGVHAAASDGSGDGGLDSSSAEYQDGWNRLVSFHAYEKYDVSIVITACSVPVKNKTDPGAGDSGISFFPHWDTYNDHQRKEWAHGCLDAERNLTNYKVPQQSWEG